MPRAPAGAAVLAVLLALGATTARAEQLVQADLAAKTLLRALAYDRSLKARASGEVVLATVRGPGSAGEEAVAFEAAVKALGALTVQDLKLRVVQVTVGSAGELDARLKEVKAQVLYVASGFDDGDAGKVQAAAAGARALTVYRDPRYQDVLALGVVPRDGKSKLVVKLAAAKGAGAELDAQLLRLCEVR